MPADLPGDPVVVLGGGGGQQPLGVVPGELPPGEDVGVGAGRNDLREQPGTQLALELRVDDRPGAEGEHVVDVLVVRVGVAGAQLLDHERQVVVHVGVDPQIQQLGAGQPVRVGLEGDPPGRVHLPRVAALPGGVGVQVVAGEGRDDPGVPEHRVGELAGEVGVAHPLGGAQVQQGERPVLGLQGGVLVVGGHLGDGVVGGVIGPGRRRQ
jgi:hypothetical protein